MFFEAYYELLIFFVHTWLYMNFYFAVVKSATIKKTVWNISAFKVDGRYCFSLRLTIKLFAQDFIPDVLLDFLRYLRFRSSRWTGLWMLLPSLSLLHVYFSYIFIKFYFLMCLFRYRALAFESLSGPFNHRSTIQFASFEYSYNGLVSFPYFPKAIVK